MNSLKPLAGQLDWATKNMAYNLDFIPDDKLNWKPAPTALSAMEIVAHLLGVLSHFRDAIENPGQDVPFNEVPAPVTRDEAKMKLIAAAEEYSHWLFSLSPDTLAQEIELSFGKFPTSFVASIPVTDAIHHHGQIAYIQSLLGDTEPHFDMSLFPG